LVADFSGSMDQDLNNNNAPLPPGVQSKIQVLREVVDEVTQTLLDNGNSASRVGFTLFNAAARQLNDKRCQMPILSTNEKSQEVITHDVYFNNYYAKEKNDFLKDASKRYGVKEGYFFDCKDEPKTWVEPRAEKKAGTRPIFDYTCKIKDTRENVIKIVSNEMYGNNLQVSGTKKYPLTYLFRQYTDVKKTVDQIDSFDGKFKSYPLTFDVPNSRLEYICPKKEKETASLSTQAWFEGKNGQKDLVKEFNAINPKNQTSASAGMIIATNAILAEDKAYRDKLDKLGKNPKRVMVVVSDGIDNFPYFGSFPAFQNNGMCEKIKKKIDSLQNPKYEKQDTRIGFIAISYDPKKAFAGSTKNDNMDNYNAWKKCVDDYYYVVKNKQQLLDAFSEILGLQEELGTSSSQKIKRK
jgi:tadG